MLPQDDILRIVAKFTAKQIQPSNIGGVLFDADPHNYRLTRFHRQSVETHVGYPDAIHEAPGVGNLPNLQQSIL